MVQPTERRFAQPCSECHERSQNGYGLAVLVGTGCETRRAVPFHSNTDAKHQASYRRGETSMGKIVNSTFVSLDGVINHMERWHFDFVDDETEAFALQQLRDSSAMLMGRNTYEVYAASWPDRDGDLADRLNEMPKYVASTTLKTADWANTTVLDGDLISAVTKLKEADDILMHGYGPVAKELMRNGLLDELYLWIHPMLAGVGSSDDLLLSEGLNTRLALVDVKRLTSGVVILSYRAN
jgi:dihydrofolate reductase